MCTNPECDGLPSFYRDIAGPTLKEVRSRVAPAAAAKEQRRVPREPSDRVTVPMVTAPVAILRATNSPGEKHFLYPGTMEVGARPSSAILIDRPDVSSRHSSIECVRSPDRTWKLTVLDHGSTNGTFVNGNRVDRRELKPGDRLRFAATEFEFRFLET